MGQQTGTTVAKPTYHRLPGKRRVALSLTNAGTASLWLGPDHLLSLIQTPYGETSKRYAYADIHSLTIRKTIEGHVTSAILFLIILAITVGIPAISLPETPAERLTLWTVVGFMSIIPFIFLIIYLFRGSTCVCELRTALQVERLRSLRHVKNAIPACDAIAAFVRAAQGDMSIVELTARAANMPAETRNGLTTPDGTPNVEMARKHQAAAWVMTGHALLCLLTVFLPVGVYIIITAAAILALAGLSIIAVASSRGTTVTSSLNSLMFVYLGYVFVLFAVIWAVVIASQVSMAAYSASPFNQHITNHPRIFTLLLISIGFECVIGVLGLVMAHGYQSRLRSGEWRQPSNSASTFAFTAPGDGKQG